MSLNLSSEGTFRKGLKINVKFGRSYRKIIFCSPIKWRGKNVLWCKNRNERRSSKGELPLRSLIVRVFDNALAKAKINFFSPPLKICVYVPTNTLILSIFFIFWSCDPVFFKFSLNVLMTKIRFARKSSSGPRANIHFKISEFTAKMGLQKSKF